MAKSNLQRNLDDMYKRLPKNEAQKFRGTPIDDSKYPKTKHLKLGNDKFQL